MIKELVRRNRSFRGYNEQRAVTREELTEMVDCARITPCMGNIQPLKYYIAWEKAEVSKIQELTVWARALPQIELPHQGMYPTGFIVILQDTNLGKNLAMHQKDCGIVAQTILLRATEMGLGGCMIGSFQADAVREVLCLPDSLIPLLIIAIGEPAETVVLTEVESGDGTNYYRDAQDIHYVPKRKLKDVLITKEDIENS